MDGLTVGKVAERCGIAVSALHFYERKGLLQCWRNSGNQRRYSKDVLRRVAIIKVAQKVGIPLSEIKDAFARLPQNRTPSKKDWQILAKHWRKLLQERINYLQRLNSLMEGCIGCGCLSMSCCPMYNEDDHAARRGVGAVFVEQGS